MTDIERVRSALSREQDEARIQRMWRVVETRRARRERFGVAPIALTASLGVVVAMALSVSLRFGARPTLGPLTLEGSRDLPAALESSVTPRSYRFSDRSLITLDARARIDVIESSSASVVLALRHGRGRFAIEPGGPRRWTIDCGVEVEVVGTEFTIDRRPDAVRVEVRRGVVVVRGDHVPDRLRRLVAGESLTVPLVEEHPAEPEGERATAPSASTPRAATEAPAALVRELRPWRDVAETGHYDDAFEALGEGGVAREARRADSVEELYTLADVARLSGHPAEAIVPLERIIEEHPSDPRAALAAYTVAQLDLDRLGRPAEAARAIERALRLGLPRTMRELAMARRVDALGRAGSPEVVAAAQAYIDAFPAGRYRTEVEPWIAP